MAIFNGTSGDDTYVGTPDNDEINGNDGDDTLTSEAGQDDIFGGSGDDYIASGADGDYLTGGDGRDEMFGGTGNDIFYILANSEAVAGEIYNGGGGDDRIYIIAGVADLSRSQLAGIERIVSVNGGLNLTLTTAQVNGCVELYASVLNLTTGGRISFGAGDEFMAWTINLSDLGNTLDLRGDNIYTDAIYGGAGDDRVFLQPFSSVYGGGGNDVLVGAGDIERLSGGEGNDRLYGGGYMDLLVGGEGDDLLDGGTGFDTMEGGAGNDLYFVDDTDDTVTEAADAGWDVVRAGIDYTLADNVEELFIGGAARNGLGNDLANTLHGSGSSNALLGLAGDDILRGGGGRDALLGDDGNDLLDGSVGKDTLTGGAGRDVFQFRDGDFGATRSLADVITDFSHADKEKIHLCLVDANTALAGTRRSPSSATGRSPGWRGNCTSRWRPGTPTSRATPTATAWPTS